MFFVEGVLPKAERDPPRGAGAVRPVRTRMNIGPNACSRPVRQPLERVRDPLAKEPGFRQHAPEGLTRNLPDGASETAIVSLCTSRPMNSVGLEGATTADRPTRASDRSLTSQ